MFCEVMAGLYIAFTFQVSHVNTNVSWPLPDKSGLVHIDWYLAILSLMSLCDILV
jgi:hypothetical protein